MKLASSLIFALMLVSSAMPQGTVQDPDVAVRIAEKALIRVYGKKKIESERPFTAKLENGIWIVSGTLHCKDKDGKPTEHCDGGVAVAKISQADGRVLSVTHYK